MIQKNIILFLDGIIDCTKQLDKCNMPKWFGVLSRFCAGSCGLCARTACRDYDNTCRLRKELCLKEDTMDYMRQSCARTCGFCIVGDLIDRENENNSVVELLSNLAATSARKPIIGEITSSSRNMPSHRLIESLNLKFILKFYNVFRAAKDGWRYSYY